MSLRLKGPDKRLVRAVVTSPGSDTVVLVDTAHTASEMTRLAVRVAGMKNVSQLSYDGIIGFRSNAVDDGRALVRFVPCHTLDKAALRLQPTRVFVSARASDGEPVEKFLEICRKTGTDVIRQ